MKKKILTIMIGTAMFPIEPTYGMDEEGEDVLTTQCASVKDADSSSEGEMEEENSSSYNIEEREKEIVAELRALRVDRRKYEALVANHSISSKYVPGTRIVVNSMPDQEDHLFRYLKSAV